jgi:subtilase family serine protease
MRKLAWLGSAVALLLFPSFATAAQHPMALSHPPAPFGNHSKAACPPQPGKAQCLALTLTNAAGATVVNALPSGYGPVDLQTAYDLAALSATNGTGKTVAIVDAGDDPSAESDLGVYRSTYGLSPCTTANGCFKKVDQNGGTNYPAADGWDDEISLDLDMVSAIAPNAHILLVEANDANWTNLGAAVNEAASLGANAISNSYAGSESDGAAYNSDYDHPGIAVTVASGDWGYDGCSGGPCFPASSQYVEAVGGTSLTSTDPRVESAWSGSGSGCSAIFPKPAWQTDSGCAMRTVADVSADADPYTGVAVYDSQPDIGGWAILGGTSASSPMLAAFDTLVGSAAASPSWAYSNNVWNDVTTGSDGTCGTYLCNAGPGYDGPTGLGTPFAPEPPTIAGWTPSVATIATSYSGHVTVTGIPTPTVTVAESKSIPGLTLSSAGTLSGIPTTPGSYPLTVTAHNTGGSAQKTVTLAVLPKVKTPPCKPLCV